MRELKKIILLGSLLTLTVVRADEIKLLKESCRLDGGKIVQRIVCPQSKVLREDTFCKIENGQFYNGCTSSIFGYGEVFFEACKSHDNCYHHEPATNGLSKEDCDEKFYDDMMQVCQSNFFYLSCENIAYSFYSAVKYLGDKSWNCSNSYVDY